MKNKVALVTGSAKRVGKTILLRLAERGYDVICHFLSSQDDARVVVEQAKGLGVKALGIRADLRRSSDIQHLFGEIRKKFGRLDVLVNCAGVFRQTPFDNLTEEDFDFHVTTNLKAPYLCSVRAWEIMKEYGGGKIINIADVAAFIPFKNHIPYCISKAGLIMLTKSMAKAFAPFVQVHAIAPSTVLWRDDESEDQRKMVVAKIPAKGIPSPDDVAQAVLYLCETSVYVTGNIIFIDGGRSLV